jgi:hypothetical protein
MMHFYKPSSVGISDFEKPSMFGWKIILVGAAAPTVNLVSYCFSCFGSLGN